MRIVIDTETTGFKAGSDELLQIAVADYDGKELFLSYLRPERVREWPGAQRVNGISPEMVKNCPTAAEVRETVQEIINAADEVIGYNIEFDLGFLEAAGLDFGGKKITDTMLLFAEAYGEWDDYHGDYRWQKLGTAAAYVGYEEHDAHDAMGDVLATIAVQRWLEK